MDEPEVCTGCGERFTDMDAIEEVGIPELSTLPYHSRCLVLARRAHGQSTWPLIDAEPCFMCTPSILGGSRCATGYPLCGSHRDELLGRQRGAGGEDRQ